MATTSIKSSFWKGFRAGLPFIFVIAPFAVLFGIVATEAGLNVAQTLVFSVAVIAGASQFTAVHLLTENTPTVIVIVSALAVNLRMAMYSASLAPYFGGETLWKRALSAYLIVDQSYALTIVECEEHPKNTSRQNMAFFFGTVLPIVPIWYSCTLFGAWGGQAIPESFAIDFALPITFLAMVGPMLRTAPHMIAAFVSVAGSLLLVNVPYSLGLLVAALFAMSAGAWSEQWLAKRGDVNG